MKNYISKNWHKILVAIGSCVLVYILVLKFVAPKALIENYIKYGKDVTPAGGEVINSAKDNVSSVFGNVPAELLTLTFVIMALILLVVLLTSIAAKAGEKKDAKKK